MAYCARCGKINSNQAKFCKECGAEIQPITEMLDNALDYAGFWRRFGAHIIDSIVMYIIIIIVGVILAILLIPMFTGIGMDQDGAFAIYILILYFIALVLIPWIYYAQMESSPRQATPGKMAVGIIVTDLDGNRISFGRATGRHFAKIISAIPFSIGFLIIGFTEKKQGLHDMIAGCKVIIKR